MGNQRKQLMLEERYQIKAFCKLNFSTRTIAEELALVIKRCQMSSLAPALKNIAQQQMQIRRKATKYTKYTKCSTSLKERVR